MRAFSLKLRQDELGVSVIEFAIVAPAFLALLMGGLDFGHTLYMQAVLQGTVQKAARDSSLATGAETAQMAIIDDKIRGAVRDLNTSLADKDIEISRTSYSDFTRAQAAQPEDANEDGICSPGEVWIDRNFNSVYDAKGGSNGTGSAKDVLVFSVKIVYPRLFPVAALIGMSPDVSLSATTVLANQPYGDQVTRTGSLTPKSCA
ncbi:MAG: TadE/TadG family type IV pilus assembly protein [Sphingobium sp.]